MEIFHCDFAELGANGNIWGWQKNLAEINVFKCSERVQQWINTKYMKNIKIMQGQWSRKPVKTSVFVVFLMHLTCKTKNSAGKF